VSLTPLSSADFAGFFEAVHGVPPFPWQDRLLCQVAKAGVWPAILDLPTGSGKTAALDIAVFHLALEASRGRDRRAPIRIAFVVDRRLIVDDAFARAGKLQAALAAPGSEIVERVAAALCWLSGEGEPPLLARRLRGGVPREDDWARTPCQPTILCSTVDQVGSRLLFRGYGVSDRMKPVHAGLLGSDCLILLDEAHLSRPFRRTLQAVTEHRNRSHDPEKVSPAPFCISLLTATPGEASDRHYGLEQEDRVHPILRRRLEVAKPAKLVEIRGRQGQSIEDQRVVVVEEQVAAALEHLSEGGMTTQPVIGIVVNRVLRARRIFRRLCEHYRPPENNGPPVADVFLVIGPAREVDRASLGWQLEPIKTGCEGQRRDLLRPRIIVATQTIEAGADLDFDALITEIAPLDALKQRFGRLNRAGRAIAAYAAILAHREDVRPVKEGDPIYGMAAAATWDALQKLAKDRGDGTAVDFGASASGNAPWIGRIALEQIEADGLLASKPDAPVMMPAYVDLWSQTSPVPGADPEISLFLHGPDRSPATIQIIWRADLQLDYNRVDIVALFAALPPRPAEAIEMPLAAARNWLRWLGTERADGGADFADVPERDAEVDRRSGGAPVFRWAGTDSDRTGIVSPRQLQPNDLIVVPAAYGGCDEFGWNFDPHDPANAHDQVKQVTDVADKAAEPFAARRYALRLTPDLIRAAAAEGENEDAEAESRKAAAFATDVIDLIANWHDSSGRRRISDLISALQNADPPQRIAEGLRLLDSPRRRQPQAIFPYGEDEQGRARGVVLLAPKGVQIVVPWADKSAGGTPATEDDWQGSLSGEAQTLAEHSQEVYEFAVAFAERAGLNDSAAHDVALAAYLHDAGKADSRFQAMLYGGNWFAVDQGKILAKSIPGVGPDAAERAGLPRHWRHEALSVRLARKHARLQQANDKELVLWLIGVHHGYGRPLFPHCDPWDAHDREDLVNIDGSAAPLKSWDGPQSLAFSFNGWDWAQIFDRLKRRYGVWELARMEAIVRLADHRASEAAEREYAEKDA
jgi:CRISPR-associated endonuclease/helicase Cas3